MIIQLFLCTPAIFKVRGYVMLHEMKIVDYSERNFDLSNGALFKCCANALNFEFD